MEIRINLFEQKVPLGITGKNLKFGTQFTHNIFIMDYKDVNGWYNSRIVPYSNFILDPASSCLHYGQSIFEGLKAYKGKDKKIRLFRPEANAERLNKSAQRMCMPAVDEDFFVQALKAIVKVDKDWIPTEKGTSLYVRPFMFATEAFLGVRPAKEYIFAIILCPVGAYYPEGFNPVKIYVEDKYVRAVPGGVGEAKTCGNYAASLMASVEAQQKGFTQVLWLDAVERKYIEEVGTMNIFFVINDTVVSPSLSGSILPGITRDSVIKLCRHWGLNVEERPISINEIIEKSKSKELKECFGTGTAAVISPVGLLHYRDEDFSVNGGKTGEIAQRLFDTITDIQYGEKPDEFGWIELVE